MSALSFCSKEQNQAQAKLVFDFARTYNKKIVKCEARLTARPAGFLSVMKPTNQMLFRASTIQILGGKYANHRIYKSNGYPYQKQSEHRNEEGAVARHMEK